MTTNFYIPWLGEKRGHIGHFQSADFLCIIVLCLVPSFVFFLFPIPNLADFGDSCKLGMGWKKTEDQKEVQSGDDFKG
jgi:hypothetical protein